MLSSNDYQRSTTATAIYPQAGTGTLAAITYAALELAGESAEVLEKELERDLDGISAELGKTAWYLARLRDERDMTFSPTADHALSAATLVVRAGRVAEIVKKLHRDNQGKVDDAARERLRDALGAVLTAWAAAVDAHGLCVPIGPADDHAKLSSRARRGVLAGSGDHR